MTFEAFLSLLALSAAAAWTPGPNNSLLANSGARFGIKPTLPHIAGIAIGFPVMIFIIAIGLGVLFQQSAFLREALRWGGSMVLLWLAYKIATAPVKTSEKSSGRPFRFIEAAAFQWINPKAWIMAISATSQFVNPQAPILGAAIISSVFVVFGFGSALSWTFLGKTASLLLTSPTKVRIFNWSMAALIVVSVLAIMSSNLA